jgi:hypothetical protein
LVVVMADAAPPQSGRRRLTDLERVIAGAEATREQAQQVVNGLAGADRRRAEAYLRIAEDRLAQLYRSRDALLSDENQEQDDEQPSAL